MPEQTHYQIFFLQSIFCMGAAVLLLFKWPSEFVWLNWKEYRQLPFTKAHFLWKKLTYIPWYFDEIVQQSARQIKINRPAKNLQKTAYVPHVTRYLTTSFRSPNMLNNRINKREKTSVARKLIPAIVFKGEWVSPLNICQCSGFVCDELIDFVFLMASRWHLPDGDVDSINAAVRFPEQIWNLLAHFLIPFKVFLDRFTAHISERIAGINLFL